MERAVKKLSLAILFVSYCFSTHLVAATSLSRFAPMETDIGIIAGYTGTSQNGQITAPFGLGTFTNSNGNYNEEFGLQAKFVYNFRDESQPFIYVNGISTVGSANSIVIHDFVLVPFETKLLVNNNWIARIGVGIQTEQLNDLFQLAVGVGAAFVNQTLKTYIGETATTRFTNQQTSVAPSVMGSVSFHLCQACVAHRPLLLALQVTIDRNPQISANGVTVFGDAYSSNVSQKWTPHGDLVLSLPLG